MNRNEQRVIVRGIHLELTEALKAIVEEKVDRLFRHEHTIVRLRMDLCFDPTTSHSRKYVAKGQIEIQGPDLQVAEEADDLYKAIDGCVQKLDRMLRRRSRLQKVKRNHVHGVELQAEIPKSAVA